METITEKKQKRKKYVLILLIFMLIIYILKKVIIVQVEVDIHPLIQQIVSPIQHRHQKHIYHQIKIMN